MTKQTNFLDGKHYLKNVGSNKFTHCKEIQLESPSFNKRIFFIYFICLFYVFISSFMWKYEGQKTAKHFLRGRGVKKDLAHHQYLNVCICI